MHWFIDDERYCVNYNSITLRNIFQCRLELEHYEHEKKFGIERKISFISFDHDLGENQPTGYDILKMLINEYSEFLADNLHIYVHSQNPIGKENILAYAENYKKMFNTRWRIER